MTFRRRKRPARRVLGSTGSFANTAFPTGNAIDISNGSALQSSGGNPISSGGNPVYSGGNPNSSGGNSNSRNERHMGQPLDISRKSNARGVIIMSTNVGSLGSGQLDAGNINVRSHVARRLTQINNKHGPVDTLHLQECMNFGVEFLPFFKLPVTDDSQVTFGRDDGGVRGVCCYTKDDRGAFDTGDTKNEITCVIRSYRNKRSVMTKFASIGVYRNQSVDYSRSSDETALAIMNVLAKLRDRGVHQSIICGDFNDTRFKIPVNGYRELSHPKLYHRKNGSCAKKRIDKVITNIADVGFLEILNSCENVHKKVGAKFEESDFGHKTIVLWVGAPPSSIPVTSNTFPAMKSLKLLAKNDKSVFPAIDPEKSVCNKPYTEYLARMLTSKCEEFICSSLVTRTNRKRNNQVIMMSSLEECVQANSKKKVKNHWKSTYSYMATIKQGIGDGNENVRPSLADNTSKLNKKLKDLNIMNEKVAVKETENLFPIDLERRGPLIRTKKQVKNIIMAVSNSGATDYLGMSLKHTKCILTRNTACRNLFMEIYNRCLLGGYFPKVWRCDQVTMLYKNKGDRMLPANYRPITISPSLGKHLEKCITFFLSNIDDRNPDNHAYKAKSSCSTAIVDVQKKLLKVRNPLVKQTNTNPDSQSTDDQILPDLNLGSKSWKLISFISADDISSAFESVEHKLVCKAIDRSYKGDAALIGELVGSYLKRDAYAIERISNTNGDASGSSSGGPQLPSSGGILPNSSGGPPNSSGGPPISSGGPPTSSGGQLPPSSGGPADPEMVESFELGKVVTACASHKVSRQKITRIHHNKTAPQGSLLSPLLWRIFDAILTSIYKKSLNKLVSKSIYNVLCIDHTSYADDHLSTFTIKVKVSEQKKEIAAMIRGLTLTCRGLLIDSSRIIGCGVNPAKSESIVPEEWHAELKKIDPNFEVKASFKWLGYYLNITNDGQLVFDIETMITKLKTLERLRDNIFQYTENVFLKFKIYKTYFAPFIEFYAPIVVQSNLNITTELHRFQHNCICAAFNACHTISRSGLEKAVGEPSVLFKAIRFAKRIQFCCGTEDAENLAKRQEQNLEGNEQLAPQIRRLREIRGVSRNIEIRTGAGVPKAKKNFIFCINKLVKLESPDINDNKQASLPKDKISEWVRKENAKINRIIARRAAANGVTLSQSRRRRRDQN